MAHIHLPVFFDDAVLVSTQDKTTIPFQIRRVYFIYAIKHRSIRGKHAHKKTKQAVFCIQGSAKVHLDDGKTKRIITLNKPNTGVFVDAMVWSELYNFSRNAILLVFSSAYYKESDYVRNYQIFRNMLI